MKLPKSIYCYDAKLIRVIDGDTLDAQIDLGFRLTKETRIRLARINCPEMTGDEKPAGIKATEFVKSTLPPRFIVKSTQLDSFGRSIAEVWFKNKQDEFVNLNDLIVCSNHGKYKKY